MTAVNVTVTIKATVATIVNRKVQLEQARVLAFV